MFPLIKLVPLRLLRAGGYSETFGATIATPAVAEKGKLDVRMQVSTPGGHSSVPPAHTVSRLAIRLEERMTWDG